MKDVFAYRCPCCGKVYTHTKNALTSQIRKAKKKGVFLSEGEMKDIPIERPVFDLIDPEKDPMVFWSRGKAILGKFTWIEALLELPESERDFLHKKLIEVARQSNKILTLLKDIAIGGAK